MITVQDAQRLTIGIFALLAANYLSAKKLTLPELVVINVKLM